MRKNKVVIVGGGSTWTPGLLKSLCEKKTEFPLEELRLYDIDAERQAVIGEFAKVLFAEEYPELKFLYNPGYHAHGKVNKQKFAPEFCHTLIRGIFFSYIHSFHNCYHQGQTDGQWYKKEMIYCCQAKLQS